MRPRSPDRRSLLARLIALPLMPWLLAGGSPAAEAAAGVSLMIASEHMRDPRFSETVLLLLRHGPGGPLGVILNRPTEFTRAQLLPDIAVLPGQEQPVYFGGPVARRTLFYIARYASAPPEVITIAPGLYMGLRLQQLADMHQAGQRPSELRIFAGYAGWAPGQLEGELARLDWHLLPFDATAVFDGDSGALYQRLLSRTRLLPVLHGPQPEPA